GLFLLFGLLSFLSDFLEERYRITGLAKGFVLAAPVGAMAITSYLSGLYVPRRWLKAAIVAGLIAMGAALAAVPAFLRLVPFVLVTTAVGLGLGLMLPPLNTLITGATDAEERGLITCLYGTVRFFGVALGPPVFGLVEGWGVQRFFWGAALIGAVGLTVAVLLIRPRADRRKPQREGQAITRWEPEPESEPERVGCPLDPL
ncbi:MAG TPA: MFS transporter, partial [Limnochordia bacterium]